MAAERRSHPWVTYVLIAANLIVFALELAAGADAFSPTSPELLDLGGNFAPLTLDGEPWRLVSAMFLHAGVLHLGLNMLGLYQGSVVEALYGRLGFVAIYAIAGLLGGVAGLLRNGDAVSVGASGAVFGVYGAFGAFLVLRKAAIDQEVWQRASRQMGIFLAISLVFGFSVPGIDMSAHIGGLIGGFAVGAALIAGRSAARQRTARAIGVIAAGLALTGVALVAIPPRADVTTMLRELDRVETACVARYDAIAALADAGTITEPEAADEIERDVLVPWRAIQIKLRDFGGAPDRLASMMSALEAYVAARERLWTTTIAAIRAPTGDARAKLVAERAEQEAALTATSKALEREMAALKK